LYRLAGIWYSFTTLQFPFAAQVIHESLNFLNLMKRFLLDFILGAVFDAISHQKQENAY
jgi:hypothetical protein